MAAPVYLEVFKRLPFAMLPLRSTVLQLEGARVLWSPASTLTQADLQGAGEVTDIVAPSLLHTGGMQAAAAAHPRAKLWGPPGVRDQHPAWTWEGELTPSAWPFERELSLLTIEGVPKAREVLALHRSSSTLLVADLLFNLVNAQGLGEWLIFSLFGTWHRLAVSRLFLTFVKDKPAFKASLARLASWDFERLAPAHGVLVDGQAKSRVLAAFRERGLM